MTSLCQMLEKQELRKKLMKTKCLSDIKKHGFPYKCVDTWNAFKKKLLKAKYINEFKVRLPKVIGREKTLQI